MRRSVAAALLVTLGVLTGAAVALVEQRALLVAPDGPAYAALPGVDVVHTAEELPLVVIAAPRPVAAGLTAASERFGAGAVEYAGPEVPISPATDLGVLREDVPVVYVVDTGVHGYFRGGRDLPVVGSWSVDGSNARDCGAHGTKVASTLTRHYDELGAASGVLIDVDAGGCATPLAMRPAKLVAALDWILASHDGRDGVVNLSVNGRDSRYAAAAVRRLDAAGLTVVVSAGNRGVDACEDPWRSLVASHTVVAGGHGVSPTAAAVTGSWASNTGRCVDVWHPGVAVAAESPYGPERISGTSAAAAVEAAEQLAAVGPAEPTACGTAADPVLVPLD